MIDYVNTEIVIPLADTYYSFLFPPNLEQYSYYELNKIEYCFQRYNYFQGLLYSSANVPSDFPYPVVTSLTDVNDNTLSVSYVGYSDIGKPYSLYDLGIYDDLVNYLNYLYNLSDTYYSFSVSTQLYYVCIGSFGLHVLSTDDSRQIFGVCPCIEIGVYSTVNSRRLFDCFLQIPKQFLPSDFSSAGFLYPSVSNTDVYFLYGFGQQLVGGIDFVYKILNFNVLGVSFLSLFLTGGFAVYMSWIIVKFAIGL